MSRSAVIWNRDSILELLTREFARTAREGRTFSVMLAGIDKFKTISNEQGQSQADFILGEIGRRLSPLVRSYDYIGRYSNEQLLIIAPGCKPSNLVPLAEKLRDAVAQSPIEISGSSTPVTISLAFATSADFSTQNEDELLRALEMTLYRAESTGGNRAEPAGNTTPAQPRIFRSRLRIRVPLVLAGMLVVGIVALFFVAPSWTCAPFRLADILDSSELPPPLPANCMPTNESPSEATMQTIESQRQARGLLLQGTITCIIPSSRAVHASRPSDQQWLGDIYVDGTFEYRRHVLLSAWQDVPGGTLFTVEACLTPWWKYLDQGRDRCWDRFAFWK